jgi:RNA polymerase sigma factor (sigma-70 family)
MSDSVEPEPSRCFATTKWTVVIQVIQQGADPQAAAALEQFCRQYRGAIYNFIHRRGYSHERAEDLTHEFLETRILEKWSLRDSFLHRAQRDQGRFRSFLSHVLIRFLQDKSRSGRAITTGGQVEHVSTESMAETGQILPGAVEADPSRGFDVEFARTILELATKNLRNSDHHLAVLMSKKPQPAVAEELGMSDATFRVNHLRFRQRLAEAIRLEIRNVVGDDENDVNEEIRYLMSLFENIV